MFLKSLHPIRRIKELAQELRRAREQRDQALQDKQRVERENARLREEIERLQKELEAAQRAARRQAAPFSRASARVIRNPQAANRAPAMERITVGPSRSLWMKRLWCRFRRSVRGAPIP